MNKRVSCLFESKTPELYSAITICHDSVKHPFRVITPAELGASFLAVIPSDGYDRRIPVMLDRVLNADIPFSAEIRGIDEVSTVAEYQFWGLSDWIAGDVGGAKAGQHFFRKSWEEYMEAQEDVNDFTPGLKGELADFIFCTLAYSSNEGINVDKRINDQLNVVLPVYAQRTTKKPVRFSRLQTYIVRDDELPLKFAMSTPEMEEFFQGVPKNYFDFEDGMVQPTPQRQIRLYRTLLSSANAAFNKAVLATEDDEYDFDDEKEYCQKITEQYLVRAVLLSLLISAHIAKHEGTTLEELINQNVRKISDRVAAGMAASSPAK